MGVEVHQLAVLPEKLIVAHLVQETVCILWKLKIHFGLQVSHNLSLFCVM